MSSLIAAFLGSSIEFLKYIKDNVSVSDVASVPLYWSASKQLESPPLLGIKDNKEGSKSSLCAEIESTVTLTRKEEIP